MHHFDYRYFAIGTFKTLITSTTTTVLGELNKVVYNIILEILTLYYT